MEKCIRQKKTFWNFSNWFIIIFDYISLQLLVAEFHAYGLLLSVFKPVNDYFLSRKMRKNVGFSHGTWKKVPFGIPQYYSFGTTFIQ